jgi:hypothetical protein
MAMLAAWAWVAALGAAIPPEVQLTRPASGSAVGTSTPVVLEAVTTDADGYASEVEFYAGDKQIGVSRVMFVREPDPGLPIHHSYTWDRPPAGSHRLTARTRDDSGLAAVSEEVLLMVWEAEEQQPRITGVEVRDRKALVRGRVPAGIRKVTLESRARLGQGAWIPRAISRLDGSGAEVLLEIPLGPEHELLRLRADATEPLPAGFYQGTNQFLGQMAAGDVDAFKLLAGAENSALDAAARGGAAPTAEREVVESDIWQIRGNSLYFFNQYRGLQLVDLSQPEAPVLSATLALPAAGEQMYVLEGGYAVLLVRDLCDGSSDPRGEIVIARAAGASLEVVSRLPVQGTIQESRLVGQALYVAAQTYRPVVGAKEGVWEWGTSVSSFDLAVPAAPVAKPTLWYPGYGHVIAATDRFLFIAIRDVSQWNGASRVHCVDISSPDGALQDLAVMTAAGQVKDKFKMHVEGDVFTVVSEQWHQSADRWTTVTKVETFSLADPTRPEKLGQLDIARGETLYATRFAGQRLYAVTFLRVDPLWIIDLSDPRRPAISGELEIPGWSTFIQPWGDRLVTVGIDNTNGWRVAVQLFDVSDVRAPKLLSKVPLGENHSWSEANSDEKAFTFLPDAGLILLPYQGYTANGYASRVQLIDITPTTLTARGTIEHRMNPRRATAFGDRVISLSGLELLTVDASDRDQPQVRGRLELSWPAHRVWPVGDYLIEMSRGDSWMDQQPSLRVVEASAPDAVLHKVDLETGLSLLGTTLKDDTLWVLQGRAYEVIWTWFEREQQSRPTATNEGRLVLSAYRLDQLPALPRVGLAEAPSSVVSWGWGADLKALWPRPGLLVWASQGGGWWRGPLMADVALGVRGMPGIWWGGSGGQLIAFDAGTPALPRFLSHLDLAGQLGAWNFSEAFAADGLLFLSHQASEFVEGILLPGQKPPEPVVVVREDGTKVTEPAPVGVWMQRHFLDVVDYADPQAPTLRPAVNTPGALRGIAAEGALLYTVGSHWNERGETDWSEWLDVSAYDGVQAALVRSLRLPTEWPRPLWIGDGRVFLGRPNSGGTSGNLEEWALDMAGQFQVVAKLPLSEPAQDLRQVGSLLLLQRGRGLDLVDVTTPGELRSLGGTDLTGCIWPDLRYAAQAADRSVWLPMGDYGVRRLEVKAP